MKKPKRSKYGLILTIVMSIYAALFICIAYQGFSWFWDYIGAYERSRPQTTIDAYMEQLDVAQVQDGCAELISTIDHHIQSEESCRDAIAQALTGGISYARKLNECNDTTTVYMLLSGGKTIGKVTLTAQPADEFGFTPWVVSNETFDLSFLIGQGTSITVPSNYPVYANGALLGPEYITESGIQFDLVKDFYDEYDLPTKVTYEVDAVMGDISLTVTDPTGAQVTEEVWLDELSFLSTCTEAQLTGIGNFSDGFVRAYVNYTTNSGGASRYDNYDVLSKYLLDGSSLQKRMKNALDGLMWVTSRNAQVLSVNVDRCIPLSDGRILCDITYSAKYMSLGFEMVTETHPIQLILVETEKGIQAETMFTS